MIVVADTSPINYLVEIGHVDVLPQLYSRVLVPQRVAEELRDVQAPEKVRTWMDNLPEWFEVVTCPSHINLSIAHLDPGEQEAITLSREMHADYLLVDDMAARTAATQLHIQVIGTLGILTRASYHNLLDLPTSLAALQETSFFVAPELIQQLLLEDARRKKG